MRGAVHLYLDVSRWSRTPFGCGSFLSNTAMTAAFCFGFFFIHLDEDSTFHQGREFIANGPLENGAFCTVFSENFHNF
jgi:hypothetical protein